MDTLIDEKGRPVEHHQPLPGLYFPASRYTAEEAGALARRWLAGARRGVEGFLMDSGGAGVSDNNEGDSADDSAAAAWEYRRDGDYFSVGPFKGKDNGEGDEADYHLAAAAPELLAAALEARRVLAAVQGLVVSRDPGTRRCLGRLDDAIRKARGPLPEGEAT